MNTNEKLKIMLMGASKNKAHAKEEAQERKQGKKSSLREESLEDAKGNPISVRVREGKQPFPFQKRK